MPQEYGDDRLVFLLSSDDAVELDKLGDGFAGLASQFRKHLVDSDVDPDQVPAKLFVTNVKSGSIEFELSTLAALYMTFHATADGYVIWMDFYDRLKQTLEYLAGRAPRPDRYGRSDAGDFDKFLSTVAGKRGGQVKIRRAKFHQKLNRRETIAEFDFTEQDIAAANLTLARDLTEWVAPDDTPTTNHKTENRVPFIWHRTDREKGKAAGQTSDRGIVAKITDRPIPVFFASEIDNFKDKMIKTRRNPFELVYLVDVSVEYDEDNNPKSYTILNIHETTGGAEI